MPKSAVPLNNDGSPNTYMPKSAIPYQSPQQNQQPTQQKGAPLWMRYLLPLVGQSLGSWGGGALGVAGGAAIPGADLTGVPEVAGGYAGHIAGGSVGDAAGTELYNMIDKAMGGQGNADVGNAAQWGAGSEAIGIPGAKLSGAALHPLQSLVKGAGPLQGLLKTIANSKANINTQPIVDTIINKVAPGAVKAGLGVEGQNEIKATVPAFIDAVKARQVQQAINSSGMPQSFEDLISNPDMASSTIKGAPVGGTTQFRRMGGVGPGKAGPPGYLKEVNVQGGASVNPDQPLLPNSNLNSNAEQFGNVQNMQLPMNQAYGLKSDYQDLVNNSGGYGGSPLKPTTQGQKAIAAMLRNQIHSASPTNFNPLNGPMQLGVSGYDKALQFGHNAENVLNVLNKIPIIGHPLNTILGAPRWVAQRMIPQSGGAWNQINPWLLNLLGTATNVNNQNQ